MPGQDPQARKNPLQEQHERIMAGMPTGSERIGPYTWKVPIEAWYGTDLVPEGATHVIVSEGATRHQADCPRYYADTPIRDEGQHTPEMPAVSASTFSLDAPRELSDSSKRFLSESELLMGYTSVSGHLYQVRMGSWDIDDPEDGYEGSVPDVDADWFANVNGWGLEFRALFTISFILGMATSTLGNIMLYSWIAWDLAGSVEKVGILVGQWALLALLLSCTIGLIVGSPRNGDRGRRRR